jgi:predicted nucleotidyltransferase
VRVEYAPSKKRIDKELRSYAKRLLSNLKLRGVVLFGSYAADRYGWGSDVDVLVVADDMPKDWTDRYPLLAGPDFPAELQPFGYSSQEFSEMIKSRHSLAVEALRSGEVIYATEDFAKEILQIRGPRRGLPQR